MGDIQSKFKVVSLGDVSSLSKHFRRLFLGFPVFLLHLSLICMWCCYYINQKLIYTEKLYLKTQVISGLIFFKFKNYCPKTCNLEILLSIQCDRVSCCNYWQKPCIALFFIFLYICYILSMLQTSIFSKPKIMLKQSAVGNMCDQ